MKIIIEKRDAVLALMQALIVYNNDVADDVRRSNNHGTTIEARALNDVLIMLQGLFNRLEIIENLSNSFTIKKDTFYAKQARLEILNTQRAAKKLLSDVKTHAFYVMLRSIIASLNTCIKI